MTKETFSNIDNNPTLEQIKEALDYIYWIRKIKNGEGDEKNT